jgi:predicted Ser/Thr protein kinase
MSTDQSWLINPSGTVWSNLAPHAGSGSPRLFAEPAEKLPEAVGKYQVRGLLGTGAMGIVYKCSQPGLDRPVAVKVMIAGRHASSEQIVRFQREAWAAAQLAHPNVLHIYDIGSEGERNYFVMEYVDGCSLDRLIGKPALTLERSLRLVYQLARTLQAAHSRGIIHRDIKPSNILLTRSGQPKLADFGLAKVLHGGSQLSGSGDIIGTPKYMSPEQAIAVPEEVDARTDIYSLGAVMYEMLTGKPPVDGPNVVAILRRLTDELPTPLHELNPAVPIQVAAICHKAMAKEKDARFVTAEALADEIERYLAGAVFQPPGAGSKSAEAATLPARRWPSKKTRRLLVPSALLVLIVAGFFAWFGPFGRPHPAGAQASGNDALAAFDDDAGEELVHPPSGSPRRTTPVRDTTAQAISLAREKLLGGSLTLAGNTATGVSLKGIIDDMTTVLKVAPEKTEARFLRTRAHRAGGEYLAAAGDATELLRKEPGYLAAVAERMLANYQFYVLYLGNLNDYALRPICWDRVRDDVQFLARQGSITQKHEAKLVEALAKHDYAAAGKLAEDGPPPGRLPSDVPDLMMLHADTLFHFGQLLADEEQNTGDEADKAKKGARREHVVHAAHRALNTGLEVNPNHVGLRFLQADTFQRALAWETAEGDNRDTILRKNRAGFEAALDRLRSMSLIGSDPAVARAVLFTNRDRDLSLALDRVNDALHGPPTVPYLYTFRAWLRLQTPPDGTLSPEDVTRILAEFRPAFDVPPDDHNTYFVRALVYAAAGRWDEARQDLLLCRRKLGKDTMPAKEGIYAQWFSQAPAARSKFMDATAELLWYLSVPDDLRVHASQEILQRLANADAVKEDKLPAPDVRRMQGNAQVRLAKLYAGKNDEKEVLQHVRAALELRLSDITTKTFREDETFKAYNDKEEFVKLYKRFETPS